MTVGPINPNIPLSVDYTSRDYYSLRNDLIARVRTRIPEWQGTDVADFGVAMIEAFAYLGDVCNYYIDRVANENFISTATQRQSVLNIARSYGYDPSGWKAADLTLSFGNKSSSTSYTLPIGTQVAAYVNEKDITKKLVFTTTSSVTVAAGATTAGLSATTVAINQVPVSTTAVYGVKLATGNGVPGQVYVLPSQQVVDGSVQIYTYDGNEYTVWTEVNHLAQYTPGDLVYETRIDGNNAINIFFGDGISGSIPTNDIYVDYFIGGGNQGNISPYTIRTDISSIIYVPGWNTATLAANNVNLSVTNTTAGIGGSDPEETNSIRVNAPRALTSLRRAITLKDYESLAYSISGVGKAHAIATSNNTVSIFIAPYRATNSTDETPGVTSTGRSSVELEMLRDQVYLAVQPKAQVGTSVLVNPPLYSPVTIEVEFDVLTGYTQASVLAGLEENLARYFSYSSVVFNSFITADDISAKLIATTGLKQLTVTKMYRTADTSTAAALSLNGGDNELFVFNNLIGTAPGELFLDSLTTAQAVDFGGINPVFNASTYFYSTTFTSVGSPGPGTVTVTFAAGITATLNGSAMTSGTAKTLTGSGSDGTRVYTIELTKANATTATYTLTVVTINALV
jgi:hypothetical protein